MNPNNSHSMFSLVAAAIAVLFAPNSRPAAAQSILLCGTSVTRHLAAGAQDSFPTFAPADGKVVVDVADTGGTIGLLRIDNDNGSPGSGTCEGSDLLRRVSTITVSDCIGSDSGQYAVSFSIVNQVPENCGVALTCGVPSEGSELRALGETDSFTFQGSQGQTGTLRLEDLDHSGSNALRLRVFQPDGTPLANGETCSGQTTLTLPQAGLYTVLVNACTAPVSGKYSLLWESQPSCPAVPPGGEFAYIVNDDSGTVSVVDVTKNEVVSLIPLTALYTSGRSSAVTSPNNAFLAASFPNVGTLSIINTATNRVIGRIPLPEGDTKGLVFHPDSRTLFVADDQLNAVVVIDMATRRAVTTIPLAIASDGGIAISPDGSTLYVTKRPEGIAIIDVATRTVIGAIEHPALSLALAGMVMLPDGRQLYVATISADAEVLVIDTQSRQVIDTIHASAVDLFVSPLADRVYLLGSAAEGLIAIDPVSRMVVGSVGFSAGVGGKSFTPAKGVVSRDGKRIYISNADAEADRRQPQIAAVVIDATALSISGTIPAFGNLPGAIAIAQPPPGLCAGDQRGQARVTVGELVASVNYSVDGCPNGN